MDAQEILHDAIRRSGPQAIVNPNDGFWKFEQGNLAIELYYDVEDDVPYRTLLLGLQGVIDLMSPGVAEGGVGTVAAWFQIKQDGRGRYGTMAEGRLRDLSGEVRQGKNGTASSSRPTQAARMGSASTA